MDKKQVAQVLHEIGVLLELKGENQFKVRAYLSGARTIEMLSEDITQLVAAGTIRQLQGIGPALAEKITQLVTTGDLPYYRELQAGTPKGLLEMLRIPGLGPKKICTLHQALNICDVAALAYACHENRLIALKGFGKKTQDSILKGIAYIKTFQGQFLYGDVIGQAEALVEQLRRSPDIQQVSIAGSLRRCKEIVKDIDVVAAAADAAAVMDCFASIPGIAEVSASGETKTSVRLLSGINADLRVVEPEAFPCGLHHFTGSKEHNTAIRQRAKGMGLKINEYGLFEGERRIQIKDEEGFFAAQHLQYIPPEIRENGGEIEAAEQGVIPELLVREDVRGVFHVHTNYSDGLNTLEELVTEARNAGFSYLGISDHSQTASYAGGLKIDRVKRQHQEVQAFNAGSPDFHVFHGIESDIHQDGGLDYPEEILRLFDFVIASVHSGFSMTRDQATRRLTAAMANPFVTMLGHPTGRLLMGRQGYALDMEEIIRAARANRVIIELNANPQRLDIDWRYLKRAGEQGVLISINPDAHRTEGLHDTFFGVGIARKGWLGRKGVFNTWPLPQVKQYLEARKQRA